MKFIIGCVVIASLAACVSQPVQPVAPAQPQSPPPTALQTMISMCDLSASPDLQILSGKFPLSLNQIQQPGITLLSTERGPSVDEQAALARYDQLHRPCVMAQANWLAEATYGTMPEVTSLQQKMFATEQAHLAALYQSKETFAQFTRAVNVLHVQFMSDTSQMAQSAYDNTQQQIRSSAPVQTNCQAYYDGSVRCTSQQ